MPQATRRPRIVKNSKNKLPKDKMEFLLTPHEIVRDPVHCDIVITALERKIIDTEAFQRLRFLMQLGPTHIVYPGAVHNRFLHSLGTLYCANMLVDIVNKNYAIYSKSKKYFVNIEPYPHLLIRLCALLHDVAHVPFGHTLEDEGNLSKGEWDDTKRSNLWLGKNSEMSKTIIDFVKSLDITDESANIFMEDIRKYILHNGDLMDLEYPFISDLISNTICADLLDYIDRDNYFCGLTEKAGYRTIKYFAAVNVIRHNKKSKDNEYEYTPTAENKNAKARIVLLQYRLEKEHGIGDKLITVKKKDILSEAVDLLRRRFSLAEKVYFHRTKLAASAMIISAMVSSELKMKDIYQLTDNDFLNRLSKTSNARAKNLINAYTQRRLYKVIYKVIYHESKDDDVKIAKLKNVTYQHYRVPANRKKAEEKIEKIFELAPGTISVYCPDESMNMKEFDVLMQSNPEMDIKPLKSIFDQARKKEMEAINSRFQELWCLVVYGDIQNIGVEKICRIRDYCESEEMFDYKHDDVL